MTAFAFHILTLAPELFEPFMTQGLLGKAVENRIIDIKAHALRDFGLGKHRQVDDAPYGGGAGMLLKVEPVAHALDWLEGEVLKQRSLRVLITPQGQPFTQRLAHALIEKKKPVTLICGRYEGFDERIRNLVDLELSLGDFILLGGEVAAMAVIEATARLLPGAIGNQGSISEESFEQGLLEYAQYTRPREFQGRCVPEVLISGDHAKVKQWRQKNALERTKTRRPDLYEAHLKDSKTKT